MDVHEEPEIPQEPLGEDQDQMEAQEGGPNRYWLFNLLELLTPMPEFDDEEDEECNEEGYESAAEIEEQGDNARNPDSE